MVLKYRKKPIEIEAFQLWLVSQGMIPDWWLKALDNGIAWTNPGAKPHAYAVIKTLEGEMKAYTGDWIIRGVEGEIYPCKDSIFRASYEEVK